MERRNIGRRHVWWLLGSILLLAAVKGYADFTIGKPIVLDAPINEGPHFESFEGDYYPCLSGDELTLYFGSERPGGAGSCDIWIASRATVTACTLTCGWLMPRAWVRSFVNPLPT